MFGKAHDKQANWLVPFMFIAQEPHTPSLQDLRKASVLSCSFLILNKASKTIAPQLYDKSIGSSGNFVHKIPTSSDTLLR